MSEQDLIARYIELKKQAKDIEEEYRAIETLIFADDNLKSDGRIRIMSGRKSYVIKPEAYDNLKSVGINVEVTETRLKKLEEFDVDIQKAILSNPENYTEKCTKDSIRVK